MNNAKPKLFSPQALSVCHTLCLCLSLAVSFSVSLSFFIINFVKILHLYLIYRSEPATCGVSSNSAWVRDGKTSRWPLLVTAMRGHRRPGLGKKWNVWCSTAYTIHLIPMREPHYFGHVCTMPELLLKTHTIIWNPWGRLWWDSNPVFLTHLLLHHTFLDFYLRYFHV